MSEGVLAPKLCDSINFSSESAEEFGAGASPKTRACEGLVMQTCKDVRMQNVILNLIIVNDSGISSRRQITNFRYFVRSSANRWFARNPKNLATLIYLLFSENKFESCRSGRGGVER